MKTPVLINAAHMAKTHPQTFFQPDPLTLQSVGPGSLVKVAVEGERFWVSVTEERAADGVLIGTVDNVLVGDHNLRYGDQIAFVRDNVYDVYLS